ncbi:MAG: nucleoside deaminase [Sandaracinus sp.]|nr:tRNA adenosine(34) deaminase TadA [Myxococcales bacterium]MCB9611070.1 nucleoside deaminase [Sandaracinus sp.]MCB9630932.1 nucleoside deaminase [Sandaracinus sp.]
MSDADDERFMREALLEAAKAEARGEVPVGAVVVVEGKIVGRGHNLRETAQDPLAHAELIAVRAASARLGSWRLVDATVFVTLEPCPMCAGMLVNARVPRVVWGADDPKAGACRTLFRLGEDPRLNHRFESVPGVLVDECADTLRRFFAQIRARRKG